MVMLVLENNLVLIAEDVESPKIKNECFLQSLFKRESRANVAKSKIIM